jgi:hypothetical protein
MKESTPILVREPTMAQMLGISVPYIIKLAKASKDSSNHSD